MRLAVRSWLMLVAASHRFWCVAELAAGGATGEVGCFGTESTDHKPTPKTHTTSAAKSSKSERPDNAAPTERLVRQ